MGHRRRPGPGAAARAPRRDRSRSGATSGSSCRRTRHGSTSSSAPGQHHVEAGRGVGGTPRRYRTTEFEAAAGELVPARAADATRALGRPRLQSSRPSRWSASAGTRHAPTAPGSPRRPGSTIACRPRRNGRPPHAASEGTALRLGSATSTRRAAMSSRRTCGAPPRRASSPRGYPGGPGRHDRQRLGMDQQLYRPYPYAPDDGREDPEVADVPRVVRGGSWSGARGDARCAYRDHDHPGDRRNDLGFRVVVSPPSLESLITGSLITELLVCCSLAARVARRRGFFGPAVHIACKLFGSRQRHPQCREGRYLDRKRNG